MQRGPLIILICGRRQHCSKVIRQPGVCYCAVLSVVREMREAMLHVSVERRILIKFLTKERCKPSEICSSLKKQYGKETLSNVSVYKWSSAFKKGRERWRMNHMSVGRGVAALSTKRLVPERHPQATGPLAQVNCIPGRLCWKVTISVSENKSMFLFHLRIIIHICPPLVKEQMSKTHNWYENTKQTH
jgi:hypothetical protein